jgi:hypothetical protein
MKFLVSHLEPTPKYYSYEVVGGRPIHDFIDHPTIKVPGCGTCWEAWASAMKGDYIPVNMWRTPQFLAQYDIIMLIFGEKTTETCSYIWKTVRDFNSGAFLIGAFENRLQKHKQWCMEKEGFLDQFRDFMQTVDVFISDAPDCVEYFSLFGEPVHFLLYPYPVRYVSQFRQPLEKRRNVILKLGIMDNRIGSEGHDDIFLLSSVLEKLDGWEGFAVARGGEWKGRRAYGKVVFHSEIPWKDFVKDVVATSYVAIDLDWGHTHGRTAADCAALGVPCIGVNSSCQQLFFPGLTCAHVHYGEVRTLLLKLIEDKSFWRRWSEEPSLNIGQYDYESSRRELLRLREEMRK